LYLTTFVDIYFGFPSLVSHFRMERKVALTGSWTESLLSTEDKDCDSEENEDEEPDDSEGSSSEDSREEEELGDGEGMFVKEEDEEGYAPLWISILK
jgi:hypothetical protein